MASLAKYHGEKADHISTLFGKGLYTKQLLEIQTKSSSHFAAKRLEHQHHGNPVLRTSHDLGEFRSF